MLKPISAHMYKPVARATWYSLLLADIGIILALTYISRLVFVATEGSPLYIYGYISLVPVAVAIFFFISLVVVNKKSFYRDLEHLKKYKVKVKLS